MLDIIFCSFSQWNHSGLIISLLGAVANDVFYLTFRNAGALRLLYNRFSCSFLSGQTSFKGEFSFIVFMISLSCFCPWAFFGATRWPVASR